MSEHVLDRYQPTGYTYGLPYWDESMDRIERRDAYYLSGMVKVLEYPTWFGARFMRERDLRILEGC